VSEQRFEDGGPNETLHAAERYTLNYRGTKLDFTHIVWQNGMRAIGVNDPALGKLLRELHASINWVSGERYILITTAQPQVISFLLGDRRYGIGQAISQAAFPPFLRGEEAYLPLNELLAALSLRPVYEKKMTVLEPLITSLDVTSNGGTVNVAAFAGLQLVPRVVKRSASSIVYEFDGVGTTLSNASSAGQGIENVALQTVGRPPDQRTFVTVALASVTSQATATPATPTTPVAASPVPADIAGENAVAQVTGIDVAPSDQSFVVAIDVSGNATYEWHRLRAPDNRFWIDIEGAHLATLARNDTWVGGRVTGVRVQQFAPQTVRIALSLADQQDLSVVPSSSGVQVIVGNNVVASVPASGSGSIGTTVAAQVVPLATPTLSPLQSTWKFALRPQYLPTNPHLIVIDPGHGGADAGTVYGGIDEKNVNLDISLRLRRILMARGWQVRMTRNSDHDVDGTALSTKEANGMGYKDDPAADDLQARDDIANLAGARVFISIHVNECCNTPDPTPHGVQTYYSKPEDLQLARDLQNAIVSEAGENDAGVIKSHLYVTLHARMPAALVETAFITNPDDFSRLTSPEWRERVAKAIADGVEAYMRDNPVAPADPTQ
jgi:N-acetylmuramoyl-L-alanine amidase